MFNLYWQIHPIVLLAYSVATQLVQFVYYWCEVWKRVHVNTDKTAKDTNDV